MYPRLTQRLPTKRTPKPASVAAGGRNREHGRLRPRTPPAGAHPGGAPGRWTGPRSHSETCRKAPRIAHMHARAHTRTDTHMHTHIHAHAHMHAHARTHPHAHAYMDTRIHMHTHTYARVHTHTCTHMPSRRRGVKPRLATPACFWGVTPPQPVSSPTVASRLAGRDAAATTAQCSSPGLRPQAACAQTQQ